MAKTDAGDKQTWVLSLLSQYELPLTRFAARLLHDEEAARDVVQHALLRLCDQSPEELAGHERRWLFTVCRNRAIDMLRTKSKSVSLPIREASIGMSKEPDPADAAEKKEVYRQLNDLVSQLPPAQCEALGLWSEGFSYREIAKITERTEGSIRVQVHRAIKRLAEHPISRQLIGGDRSASTLPEAV